MVKNEEELRHSTLLGSPLVLCRKPTQSYPWPNELAELKGFMMKQQEACAWWIVDMMAFISYGQNMSMRRSLSERGSDRLQIAEKESMFVTLPVYAGWAFLSIFFIWRERKHNLVMPSSFLTSYNEHPFGKP
ncbi:hypothetical protein PanWU01x14_300300 [Parasponia andersonii]|uniref:Transmembrane protein n=1 Tax=Parasponia andersonii TaxID=3476 RepID=A0A2P5AU68_PARAD|nr:hypothetical protein PanWU01x14_300300 [Parasponia andersonii]